MSEDAGEKTFAPSDKRKREAAQKGDVLRSKELATAITILVGAVWLKLAGGWVIGRIEGTLRSGLTWDHASIERFEPQALLFSALMAAMPPVLVLGGAVMITAVGLQMGLGDGRWVPGNLAPKPSRLNPITGLGRMLGAQGWIELGKGLLKVILLGGITYAWARPRIGQLATLSSGTLSGQLNTAWDAMLSLLFWLASGLLFIALLDVPIQWIRRYRRLRMSRQELRDENKESDGNPEMKHAQRSRARQMAMSGVAGAMREAQFVITNPSHFAVALAYDPDKAPAPVVLARGRGDRALAMRELAAEMALPCLEIPPLARSVYFTTRENQMIREELYGAVASVLAFVLSLRRDKATRPDEWPELPPIEVPAELRYDAEGRPEVVDPRQPFA